MLNILQASLQQYMNRELPDVQDVQEKTEELENISWIIKKARAFQKKTSISALLTMPKPLTAGSQ